MSLVTRAKKTVWAEGVLLGQQHFQQFDDYIEHVQSQRQFIQSPVAFGFKKITIDSSALARDDTKPRIKCTKPLILVRPDILLHSLRKIR